jgi:hypothetical protein
MNNKRDRKEIFKLKLKNGLVNTNFFLRAKCKEF